MKKVSRLKNGSVVAVVSPSWSGPASYPWVYEEGIENLKKHLGFVIKEYPTTRGEAAYNASHPEERAKDLAQAFNDPEVDGVFCSIGGDDAVRLLPYLDQYEIAPKFFMGYSDSTVLLAYFNQRGFVTFHGPSIMAGFAQPKDVNEEFNAHVKDFLMGTWESYFYKPYSQWAERFLEWNNKDSVNTPIAYCSNEGWRLQNPSGVKVAKGVLWGGCVEVLEFMKGTKYWPVSESSWKDKILFFEVSDEGISESQVKWMLRNYGIQGALNISQAMIVGRFANMNDERRKAFESMVVDVVQKEFSSNIPIIFNVDFGHTYPQQIFPMGSEATIAFDSSGTSISVESPFI